MSKYKQKFSILIFLLTLILFSYDIKSFNISFLILRVYLQVKHIRFVILIKDTKTYLNRLRLLYTMLGAIIYFDL